ncbi:MAG: hypothetical protein C5B59_16850 [Bacteroidetes bacterium]|nr:MAG: hypothetical protein C5B59_16850 [Bacteroidota bacterium]
MIDLINKWLFGGVQPKKKLPFSADQLTAEIKTNRKTLNLVDNWVDDDAFARSWFNYGVPDYIKKDINRAIGEDPTYTDILLYVSKKYFEKPAYLEIGVSVGKNFFQILEGNPAATLTGFDIEDINPVLSSRLILESTTDWDTPPDSIKKNPSTLKTFRFQNRKVQYMCADVWDYNSWSKLNGKKFNIVFSDALHTPEAILFEFEMLVKYNLLDEKFVIVWDDLVGKMKRSFYQIIKRYNKAFGLKEIYLFNVNGWIGEHETPHAIGIISNFSFSHEGRSH